MFAHASEVVKIIDLPKIETNEESFQFRVEISRRCDTGEFFAKVYRCDSYRLQPTFPQINGELLPEWQGDVLFYVVDDNFHGLSGEAMEDVLNAVASRFEKIFGNHFLKGD